MRAPQKQGMTSLASPDPFNSPDEQAARWAARSAYGEMTAERRIALEEWLSADRSHRGAYLRARAGLYAMEDAVLDARPLPSDNDNSCSAVPWYAPLARRTGRAIAVGTAIAACVAGMIAIGISTQSNPRQVEAPAYRNIALSDGSVAVIGPDSNISTAMSEGIRKIVLQNGEATFRVAKDQFRPFVVQSGQVYAQATGTVYSVRRLGANGATVSVSEGNVLVWTGDERDQAVLLHAGGKLSLDPGMTKLAPEPPAPLTPELAQISLDNVPISKAATRFNKINRTKIVIDDSGVGETKIVGLFKANDPEQFAKAVAAITGARVTHRDGNIVIEM